MADPTVVHPDDGKGPATVDSLAADLRALGVEEGGILLVHSSLKALGYVSGGAVAVLFALEKALGPEGTLVMPAFSSNLTDPSHWRKPPVPKSWWETIRATMPAWDPGLTPPRKMGLVVETFLRREGTLRGDHPNASFAARGPMARRILGEHPLGDELGERSPLGRLYAFDARVLLLGVGHGNDTSLHLAEARASFPGKRTLLQGAPILRGGRREWVRYESLRHEDGDFGEIGAAFERETGAARVGQVGRGEARHFSQRELVDFGVRWMEARRGGTV